MAKSKAQRMKEYRERKKEQLGNKWLKIERERVRAYRQSVQMDPDKKEHERELGRIRQARYRNKNKVNRTLTSDDDPNESVETPSTSEDFVSSSTDTLTVKLPFTSTKSSSAVKDKKRASRALSDSYRRIETLEDQNEELRRKLKNAQKKLSRNERKKFERSDLTPRSKADKLIKESGINPDEVPEIRKQLVFGECLSDNIDANKDDNQNMKKKENCMDKETEADQKRKLGVSNDINISAGDFVVVQYDENRYCGQVVDFNNNDNTIRVNFMKECEKVKQKFKWPASEDIDWVDFDEIVKKVDAPVATSKAGRMFAFPEDVLDLLNEG